MPSPRRPGGRRESASRQPRSPGGARAAASASGPLVARRQSQHSISSHAREGLPTRKRSGVGRRGAPPTGMPPRTTTRTGPTFLDARETGNRCGPAVTVRHHPHGWAEVPAGSARVSRRSRQHAWSRLDVLLVALKEGLDPRKARRQRQPDESAIRRNLCRGAEGRSLPLLLRAQRWPRPWPAPRRRAQSQGGNPDAPAGPMTCGRRRRLAYDRAARSVHRAGAEGIRGQGPARRAHRRPGHVGHRGDVVRKGRLGRHGRPRREQAPLPGLTGRARGASTTCTRRPGTPKRGSA